MMSSYVNMGGGNVFVPDFNKLPYSLRLQEDDTDRNVIVVIDAADWMLGVRDPGRLKDFSGFFNLLANLLIFC